MLHIDVHGRGPRLVLVHGFTQTSRSWGPVLAALAARHQVVAVDAPGHGRSASYRAGMWEAARLLGEAGGTGAWLGYSMGGRLCLHLALAAPYLVRRLVLVSTTAGIDDPEERAARRRDDEARAAAVERDGVDAFLEQWLAQPLFAGLPPEAAGVEERRANTAAGLAASLRLNGTGAQEPLWDRLPALAMPVLVVAGERDGRFVELGRRLVAGIGARAELAMVEGAGHAAHLERPEAFLRAVEPFLGAGGGGHDSASPAASSAP